MNFGFSIDDVFVVYYLKGRHKAQQVLYQDRFTCFITTYYTFYHWYIIPEVIPAPSMYAEISLLDSMRDGLLRLFVMVTREKWKETKDHLFLFVNFDVWAVVQSPSNVSHNLELSMNDYNWIYKII